MMLTIRTALHPAKLQRRPSLRSLQAFGLFLAAQILLSGVHSFAPPPFNNNMHKTPSSLSPLSVMSSYMETMEAAVAKALDREVQLEPASGGGFSGGGGASTSAMMDAKSGQKYFVKSATNKGNMLRAEYLGVKAMSDSQTICVPTPIAYGQYDNKAFVVFEYLNFCGGGSQYELGVQLAKMHKCLSEKGFGFEVDNTIGATPQPNLPYKDNWADFWDEHRLGHMLKLTQNAGLSQTQVQELRHKTRQLLSHNPAPSLVHGDLWGGNKGFCQKEKDGPKIPVIFDPATYYGDREVDVAMTYLFGGFTGDFYNGYNSEWPLEEGHEQRKVVYNLYHILNHYVLFGGGYLSQAKGMIQKILRM